MGTKERREREREEVRSKILDAARDLFVEEGYDAVTMRRIAERIEYSATAIYFHFKDKAAVLRELCDTDFRRLGQQLYAISAIADPLERLRAVGGAYVDFALEHPNQYRFMFMTPKPPLEADESAITRGNPEEDAYAFLRATIAEGVALGLFRPELDDADLLAQTVWSASHGVVSLHIAKCNDDWVDWRPIADRARLLLNALLRGLVRQPAGREE